MKIQSIRTIAGPNIYHNRPVLIMTLDLEDLTERASDSFPGFNSKLFELLPGLKEHHCSPGYEGGFLERLGRGTYFAHIVEHIALEISEVVGIGVNYGKTIYGGTVGKYVVIIRYKNEEGMKEILHTAVELADALTHEREFDLFSSLNQIKRIIHRSQLGPSTKAIVTAATKRKIPWKRLNDLNLIQLGYGKYRKFIQATTSSLTSDIAVDIAQDKGLTKKFLSEGAIRVPYGKIVRTLEDALHVFEEINATVVVKPHDGNHGRGVSLNLNSKQEVILAFKLAKEHSDLVLIEEFFQGNDYRVVVVDGKLIAAARREAAHVIGDGIHTIQQLVELENNNPLRGESHEKPLTKISTDPAVEYLLGKNNLTLTSVIEKDQKVYLCDTCNISTGGTASDVTDIVHPDIKLLCERAAKIVGLDICGIDLVVEDISKPISFQTGGIIEVNAGPGIRMHHYPHQGKARDVGDAIVDFMYPNNHNGRIPIISVTGTNGKTTVTRLVGHILQQTGINVGCTTTDGIYINNKQVAEGDTSGPFSAQNVLFDPTIDFAVFETARGGIARRGLGYDWSDVGVITNVSADHLGQDGIKTIEDVLKIKSLVVERVKDGGTVVLNADVSELINLLSNPQMEFEKKNIILFSVAENSSAIKEHINKGNSAIYLKDQRIILNYEGIERTLIDVREIPMTIYGSALFNVSNVMAAIAACKAVSIPNSIIVEGLKTFDLNENNPGRINIYKINNGHILLDYGHNPEALINIGEMVTSWDISRFTGIVAAPGDRSDELINMLGIASAHVFQNIIIREDDDLRGRKSGETSQIIYSAIMNEKTDVPCTIVKDAKEALLKAINEMRPKEIVAFFYEDFKQIEKILIELNAKKVNPSLIAQRHYHYPDYEEQSWPQH
jgi:cyanophycin synthetase